MAKGNHSFTEQDIHSRFDAIVGHTVSDVDMAVALAAWAASRNKGRHGCRQTERPRASRPIVVRNETGRHEPRTAPTNPIFHCFPRMPADRVRSCQPSPGPEYLPVSES